MVDYFEVLDVCDGAIKLDYATQREWQRMFCVHEAYNKQAVGLYCDLGGDFMEVFDKAFQNGDVQTMCQLMSVYRIYRFPKH